MKNANITDAAPATDAASDRQANPADIRNPDLGGPSADAVHAGSADTEGDDIGDAAPGGQVDTTPVTETSKKNKMVKSPMRRAAMVGLVTVVALAGLAGWWGYQAHVARRAQDQRTLFLQVGKQGAVNLTTIDWQHADTDIHRILDGATGAFYDDFAKRSEPFVGVVQQTKATTVGTVTEAGVESETPVEAQVLVTVSVKTSNAVAPEQEPRRWRMRISVQKVGDQAKVSNVQFVP